MLQRYAVTPSRRFSPPSRASRATTRRPAGCALSLPHAGRPPVRSRCPMRHAPSHSYRLAVTDLRAEARAGRDGQPSAAAHVGVARRAAARRGGGGTGLGRALGRGGRHGARGHGGERAGERGAWAVSRGPLDALRRGAQRCSCVAWCRAARSAARSLWRGRGRDCVTPPSCPRPPVPSPLASRFRLITIITPDPFFFAAGRVPPARRV